MKKLKYQKTESYDILNDLKQFVRDNCGENEFALQYKISDDCGRFKITCNEDVIEALDEAYQKQKTVLNMYVVAKDGVDFNLFKETEIECVPMYCKATKRLLTAMKYYQRLDFTKKDEINGSYPEKDKLEEFYENIYININLLNDVQHIFGKHHQDLKSLAKFATDSKSGIGMINCSIYKHNCQYIWRERKSDDEKQKPIKAEDTRFEFIRNIYDCVHCFVFHQFEFGLAVDPQILREAEKKFAGKITGHDLINFQIKTDDVFAAISKNINDAKEKLKSKELVAKVQIDETEKFNVKKKRRRQGWTFMDALNEAIDDRTTALFMEDQDDANDIYDAYVQFVGDDGEEYDSDALKICN